MLLVKEATREMSANLLADVLLNETYKIGKVACIFGDGKLIGIEYEGE